MGHRASSRPYLGERRGEIPLRYLPAVIILTTDKTVACPDETFNFLAQDPYCKIFIFQSLPKGYLMRGTGGRRSSKNITNRNYL